jgi:hypothetical protein
MKRAQIQQVFIYIMALLVIGFLVLIGYRFTNQLFGQKCFIEEQKFSTELESTIERSIRYGSVTEGKITAPCDYERICFVESNVFTNVNGEYNNGLEDIDPITNINYKELYPMIWANTKEAEKVYYNVYLYDRTKPTGIPVLYDATIHTINSDDLTEGEEVICFTAKGGTFSFLIKGLGKQGIYIKT